MLDVYRAVNPTKDGKLFKIHGNSEPRCPVGGHIESLLKPVFHDAQDALESSLGSTSLAGLAEKLKIH
jgi:DNA-binding IscR family transcriptional regulator